MKGKEDGVAKKALGGMIWTFGERICAQLVTFIVSVILARLLDPSEYAIVAIVTIFVTIANVFVSSGFGSALIQKKNADNVDFSTTLYFSVAFSIVIYFVLFMTAPVIAKFYKLPQLIPVIRVMSIRIVLASINSVQQAYVAKRMEFKKFFFATFFGTAISAGVGIWMAYSGYGVWALVAQYLVNVIIDTIVLAFLCGWKPQLVFSGKRMKGLFSFGWKVMVADVVHNVCDQLRNLTLSKVATPVELSYYNQGEKFPALFINNIETSIQKVLAPVMSNAQEDKGIVLELTRKAMRMSSFVIWPLLFGLAAVGESLIKVIYTEKWIGCVPYLQLACIAYLFYPIAETHMRTIKCLGRSDVSMKAIFKSQIISIGTLVISIVFDLGATWIVMSWVVSMLFLVLFCGMANNRLVGYKWINQLSDLLRTVACCCVMAFIVKLISECVSLRTIYVLGIQVVAGGVTYVGVSFLLNKKTFMYFSKVILGYLKNIKKGNK